LLANTGASALEGGLDLGTLDGLGGQLSVAARHFTRDVPLSARFALGYFGSNPGNPYDARHIFINDNNNGTPQKDGHHWQFRFDLVFPTIKIGPQQLEAFAGVRHARFKAHYEFVGGNEVWDITSNPWGLGFGIETAFATSLNSALVLTLGVDRYFDSTLDGHDTAYSPDGNHVNPRDDYTYDDAKAAVDPPSTELLALIGWRVGL
jgi:hypothetical protein